MKDLLTLATLIFGIWFVVDLSGDASKDRLLIIAGAFVFCALLATVLEYAERPRK